MWAGVISCGQMWINTAGSAQVCPGSEDWGAAGLEPDRVTAGPRPAGPGETGQSCAC